MCFPSTNCLKSDSRQSAIVEYFLKMKVYIHANHIMKKERKSGNSGYMHNSDLKTLPPLHMCS